MKIRTKSSLLENIKLPILINFALCKDGKFARGEKGYRALEKSFRPTFWKNQNILSFKPPGIMFSL